MKVLLLLFFTFTTPIVLFITTVLYGTSAVTLKEALAASHIYSQLKNVLINIDSGDTDAGQLNEILSKRITSDYLQKKIETAIDDSQSWIKGKTTAPPVISFSEVKEDILSQNPDLMVSLKNAASQKSTQPSVAEASNDAPSSENQMDQGTTDQSTAASLSKLVQQDFSIPLSQYLGVFKSLNTAMQIALPILGILALGSLLLIVILSHGTSSKLKWVGSTFFVSALWGFGIIFFQSILVSIMTQLAQSNQNDVLSVIWPVVLEIIKQYMHSFINYQGIAGIGMLVFAAGCFIVLSMINNPVLQPNQKAAVPSLKKATKKKNK
jgi:hypothetical protein